MSALPNDGGPAFPGNQGVDGYGNAVPIAMPDGSVAYVVQNQGMALRDYFAGQALQGEIASSLSTVFEADGITFQDLADDCYRIADAMLAARKRKEEP